MDGSEASYQANGSNSGSPAKTSFPEGAAIDVLFDRKQGKTKWVPTKAPQVLGELLDSRFMLELELPSDPRMLAAIPGPMKFEDVDRRRPISLSSTTSMDKMAKVKEDAEVVLGWRNRARALREIGPEALQWVDGVANPQWAPISEHRRHPDRETSYETHYDEAAQDSETGSAPMATIPPLTLDIPPLSEDASLRISPIARRPSGRGRQRLGSSSTPIDES